MSNTLTFMAGVAAYYRYLQCEQLCLAILGVPLSASARARGPGLRECFLCMVAVVREAAGRALQCKGRGWEGKQRCGGGLGV